MRVTVFYSGKVQGVGFRYTVRRLVFGYEVCGTIQNLDNGDVKLVAEGDEAELKAFLVGIKESGLGPMIRGEQVSWSEATGEFRGFDIVR